MNPKGFHCMQALHHGSCLCGAIRYQLFNEPQALSHCHCTQCQKAHGAAFASYASVPRTALSIVSGLESLKGYQSSPGVTRQFCAHCGSSLFWHDAGGQFADWISLAVATLDTPWAPGKSRHVWLDSRPAWSDKAVVPPLEDTPHDPQ